MRAPEGPKQRRPTLYQRPSQTTIQLHSSLSDLWRRRYTTMDCGRLQRLSSGIPGLSMDWFKLYINTVYVYYIYIYIYRRFIFWVIFFVCVFVFFLDSVLRRRGQEGRKEGRKEQEGRDEQEGRNEQEGRKERAAPRGLWQHASVWYGPPSVSSVCDQTCRQNSSACFAAMLWQNHKGGWYGPPTATSLPF